MLVTLPIISLWRSLIILLLHMSYGTSLYEQIFFKNPFYTGDFSEHSEDKIVAQNLGSLREQALFLEVIKAVGKGDGGDEACGQGYHCQVFTFASLHSFIHPSIHQLLFKTISSNTLFTHILKNKKRLMGKVK